MLAQEAIGYAAFAVRRHLKHVEPPDGASEREQWLAILRFLLGTLMFQDSLETLTLALTELDRGIVPNGLKKTSFAQGGVPTLRKLTFMRMTIELVDEVVRQHDGHVGNAEAYIEDEAGVPPSTIRRWRRQLAKLAAEHRPSTFRRWMAPPPTGQETDDEKRARLAPLLSALEKAWTAAKKGPAGKRMGA